MKKKTILISIFVVYILTLVGCSENTIVPYSEKIDISNFTNESKLAPAKEIRSVDVLKYDMDITLDTKQKIVSGDITMHLKNNTQDTFHEICIRNYAASILKKHKVGSSTITSDLNVRTQDDPSIVYVDLNTPLYPNEEISVTLHFKTSIPKKNDRFGYHNDNGKLIFQLSFCFPSLAMYENSMWHTPPFIDNAEASYSKVTNYDITLHTPIGYTIAASGEEKTKGNTTTIKANNMRDIIIIASNYMSYTSEEVNGKRINNYALDYKGLDIYNKYSLSSAMDSFKLYSDVIGEYPYDEIDVVHTFYEGAMEYPGLIMIGLPDVKDISELSDYTPSTSHCLFVAHEMAHQWFYASVGNDQYNEAWIDESFAEYCEDYLYYLSGSDSYINAVNESYDPKCPQFDHYKDKKDYENWMNTVLSQSKFDKPINLPYHEYDRDSFEYSRYVYDNGALFLYELRETMGDTNFFNMLRDYYKTYTLKIAKTEDFINAIRAYDNSEKVNQIIKKYIKE